MFTDTDTVCLSTVSQPGQQHHQHINTKRKLADFCSEPPRYLISLEWGFCVVRFYLHAKIFDDMLTSQPTDLSVCCRIGFTLLRYAALQCDPPTCASGTPKLQSASVHTNIIIIIKRKVFKPRASRLFIKHQWNCVLCAHFNFTNCLRETRRNGGAFCRAPKSERVCVWLLCDARTANWMADGSENICAQVSTNV